MTKSPTADLQLGTDCICGKQKEKRIQWLARRTATALWMISDLYQVLRVLVLAQKGPIRNSTITQSSLLSSEVLLSEKKKLITHFLKKCKKRQSVADDSWSKGNRLMSLYFQSYQLQGSATSFTATGLYLLPALPQTSVAQ